MSARGTEGPRRLIEWTGERCVPWIDDPPVIYEHFHRYLFAAQLVEGRRALDLASGEGFGAALLAQRAHSVLGIDLDEASVRHATLNYSRPGLEFRVGDALELEQLEPGSFDVVVAFEMLEHLEDQERVLTGIRHVLGPEGVLIASTPERSAYSEQTGFENPFHVRELTLPEFREALAEHFTCVELWAQRTVTGSVLSRLGPMATPASGERFVIERHEDQWEVVPDMSPMYVIAVASNTQLPDVSELSVLADPQQGLLRQAQDARVRAEELHRGAEAQAGRLRDQLLRVGDELAGERRHAAELDARVAEAEYLIAAVQDELVEARQFRAGIESSQVWQLFQRLRRRGYGVLGGRQSRLGSLVERAIRFVTRGLLRRAA